LTPKHPRYGEPSWEAWLGARLAVEDLPAEWPACDERCSGVAHDPDLRLVVADLEIRPTRPRGGDWWDHARKAEIEHEPEWEAVRAATTGTRAPARLPRLTQLRRLATTDDVWSVLLNPATPIFEDLYLILDGLHAGDLLVSVSFGPSGIEEGLAGKLIVQDHPPARDLRATVNRLAEAAPALSRGLPLETHEPTAPRGKPSRVGASE
jgi:hypothetical protein